MSTAVKTRRPRAATIHLDVEPQHVAAYITPTGEPVGVYGTRAVTGRVLVHAYPVADTPGRWTVYGDGFADGRTVYVDNARDIQSIVRDRAVEEIEAARERLRVWEGNEGAPYLRKFELDRDREMVAAQ